MVGTGAVFERLSMNLPILRGVEKTRRCLMIVVIDTTELFKDPYLTGPDWILLQEFLRDGLTTLVVPQIVVQETLNHFPEQLAAAANEVRRGLGKLRKWL